MSKKPMTWLELIKLKLSEEKAKGKAPSINDIMPLAKKEWAQIKEGKHSLYIQGKAQTFARKKKGEGKTRKNSKASASTSKSAKSASNVDIQAILNEIKLCGKCKKNVEKYMKKKGMKGGNCGAMPAQTGGTCPCGGMNGGCGSCVV
jgi:hypothetical protein